MPQTRPAPVATCRTSSPAVHGGHGLTRLKAASGTRASPAARLCASPANASSTSSVTPAPYRATGQPGPGQVRPGGATIGRVLRPEYPIRTERLILRPFAESDLEDLHAFQSLPEVARYLYWEPRDREQVRQALLSMVR